MLMDKPKSKPKYEVILEALLKTIASDFKKDDLFYSQRDLMKKFDVSYITISRVLKELKSQDIIYSRQGKGIYINKIPELTMQRIPKLIIFLEFDRPYSSGINEEYLKGIMAGKDKKYFDIVYGTLCSDVNKMINDIKDASAEGVICLEGKMFSLLERLEEENIPHIVIHPIHRKHDFCIDIDDNYSIRKSVLKLTREGKKKILFIGHDTFKGHNIDKFDAYKQALEIAGIQYDEKRLINFPMEGDPSVRLKAISEGFKANKGNFDAMVVIDPRTLELVESVVTSDNIKLDKIDIIHFGNYAYAKQTRLPLSCIIDPRYSEAIELGGKMLAEKCAAHSDKQEIKLLKPYIIWKKEKYKNA
jgi:DNA-binding LacI/PurR family transcriptional regulator